MKNFIIFFLFFTITLISAYKSYDGYKVFTVTPQTFKQIEILKKFENDGIDFWDPINRSGNKKIRMMIEPEKILQITKELKNFNIPYEITIENLKENVERERLVNSKLRKLSASKKIEGKIDFDTSYFWDIDEVCI